MTDERTGETAWMIERRDVRPPQWWTGKIYTDYIGRVDWYHDYTWTEDPNKGIRFSRKIDGDIALREVLQWCMDAKIIDVTGHTWIDNKHAESRGGGS